MTDDERRARVREIEQKMAELRARLPRHSPRVDMLVELDELDDELRRLAGESSSSDSLPTV